MRIGIESIILAAALAAASTAVCAQTAPADAPKPAPTVKQMTVGEKIAEDKKIAAEKKKAAAKKKAEAKKKAADAKKAGETTTEAKPMKKKPEAAKSAPVHPSVKQPGAGPIVEKRTVTDKGKSPFTLTDKEGKPVATSPDQYDVGSATAPPKKR